MFQTVVKLAGELSDLTIERLVMGKVLQKIVLGQILRNLLQ